MLIKYFKKKIKIDAQKVSSIGKFTGLMFKKSKTENLLFEFKNSQRAAIHSYFVFFPFVAVWLDTKNRIVETTIVKPFTSFVKPKNPVRKLIEIPINNRNKETLELIVGKGKI